MGQTLQSVRPGLLGEIDYERLAADRESQAAGLQRLSVGFPCRCPRSIRPASSAVGDRLAVTWRDVTDRYEVTRALAQSGPSPGAAGGQRHRHLHDLDGGLRWISPAIQRLLGWQANDSALGQIMHPDDVEVMKTAREELRRARSQ